MNPYLAGAGVGGAAGATLGQSGGISGLLDALGASRRAVAGGIKYFMPDEPNLVPAPEFAYGSEFGHSGIDRLPVPPSVIEGRMNQEGNPASIGELLNYPEGTMAYSANQPKGGSLLPLLLGGGAAGLAALTGLGAFSPLAFMAGSGLGQLFGEGTGTINRFDTQDVFGDQGALGNFMLSAAIDPMTYLGAASGGRVASGGRGLLASSPAEQRLARLSTPEALGSRVSVQAPPQSYLAGGRPNLAPSAAPVIPPNLTPSVRSPAQSFLPPAPASLGGYEADQLGSILGTGPLDLGGLSGAAKTYQRVNPQVGALLEELGMMQPGQAGNVFSGGLPNWASMRGGSVVPTPGMQGALPHLEDLAGLGNFGHDARMRMLQRLQGLI